MSTYAWADIHGNKALFDMVMNFLQPDDTVYFLGDAIDRGNDGWEILKTIINDPRFIFIKGNHEDMMCNALKGFPNMPTWSEEMTVWSWNGYLPTISAIENDDPEIVKRTIQKVKNLPTYATYTNSDGDIFWLSHAGCNYTPDGLENIPTDDLIWDRSHFFPNSWSSISPNNIYIVHGHTPIPYLVDELGTFRQDYPEEIEPGAFYYASGHKIDIDCGSIFTDVTVLFNLDTWDEEIFTIDATT